MRTEIVGVIAARGGSKSIPKKNIAPVGGKPLIAWTVEAALACRSLARVIVTTDDAEIGAVARRFGAEVPFLRPPELAQDDTPSIDVMVHAIRWLERHERYRPDYLMLLQPTSPLRSAEDMERAVQIAQETDADSVVGVSPAHDHPYWTKSISEDGTLVDYVPIAHLPVRRQDLPAAYVLNGAMFLTRREVLLAQRTFCPGNTRALVIPQERGLDIDSAWDLSLADWILTKEGNGGID